MRARKARVLVCEVTYSHCAPERPLAHPELASSNPPCGLDWARCLSHCPAIARIGWVCFFFVGDACKSSGQENNRTEQSKTYFKTTNKTQHQS